MHIHIPQPLICVLKPIFAFCNPDLCFAGEVVTVPSNAAEATGAMRAQQTEVQARELIARVVVSKPKKYLKAFRDYWGDNLPDLSEGRVPQAERLQFWKNMKCCAGLHPHVDLPGLCRKWCHIAFDFAIAQNQWPVIFYKDEVVDNEPVKQMYDMTVPFTLTAWVCYCAQMNGSPEFTSKACQKVRLGLKPPFVF